MKAISKTFLARNYLVSFFVFTILVTLLHVAIIAWHIWPVNGDETQYWNWSQHLAFGYYSKPPMIAWLIALSTHFFGNSILAMRLPSPMVHFIASIFIFFIGRRLFNAQTGFWCGFAYILLPGVTFSSTLISTDAPLLMFWAIAFYCLLRALDEESLSWWGLTGIALGFAMLSKYVALFFPISLACYFLIDKDKRHYFKKLGPYLMLLIAVIVLLPNVFWNLQHSFVSISAVDANADLSASYFHFMKMLSFIAAQLAIMGPVFFICWLMMLVKGKQVFQDKKMRLLFAFSVPVLLVMTIEGLLVRAHGNWAATAYITGIIAVVAYLIEKQAWRWLYFAMLLNAFILLSFIFVKPIVRSLHLHVHQPTTITNWQAAGKEIASIRKAHGNPPILAANRMLLTQAMYFAKVPLSESYKWNPTGRINDQYDMVTHLTKKSGKHIILLTYWPEPFGIFTHFTSVKGIKGIHLQALDGHKMTLFAYYLTGFKGYKVFARGE